MSRFIPRGIDPKSPFGRARWRHREFCWSPLWAGTTNSPFGAFYPQKFPSPSSCGGSRGGFNQPQIMGFVQLVFLGAICLAQFLGFYGHFITQSSLNSPHPPALMGSLLSSAKPSREIKKNIKKNKTPIQLFREEEAGGIQGKPRRKKNQQTTPTKNEEQFVGLVGSLPPFPRSGCLSLLSAAQGGDFLGNSWFFGIKQFPKFPPLSQEQQRWR